jgi:hypothetical protein
MEKERSGDRTAGPHGQSRIVPPGARPPVVAHLRYQAAADEFAGKDLASAFAHIHDTNLWGGHSVSGLGSAASETTVLRQAIPELLRALDARSLLDVPCGDFSWLSTVDLGPIDYTGADIVQALVLENEATYPHPRRRFVQLDLTSDPLPRADVVLCRDCLVHLSHANVLKSLANLKRSGSAYLLTTTFLDHDEYEDIENGDWRLLNLQRPPFNLPEPLAVIVEGCREGGGAYADKALALWRVREVV